MQGLIPVITHIETASVTLRPADRLRIGAGLTATYYPSTNNGTPYIEIAAAAVTPSAYLPLADLVVQKGLPATGNSVTVLAMANSEGPSLIRQLDLYLTDNVPADGTNFRIVEIRDVDPLVGIGASVLIPGGDHDTTAGILALMSPFSTVPYELAAGHVLAASWASVSAGAVLPDGVWRVLQ